MSTQTIQQTIADYFKTQPVLKAWLFGSYSRGEQRPWSDVDILVQYDRSRPIGLLSPRVSISIRLMSNFKKKEQSITILVLRY